MTTTTTTSSGMLCTSFPLHLVRLFDNNVLIKILAVTAIVQIAAASIFPLRECESISEIDFDTNCDDVDYVPSLPLCGKGQRLSRTCVTQSQVSEACTSCELNFFQPYNNHCSTCHPCSVCRVDQRVKHACNVENDTVCENLDPGSIDSPETAIPSSQTVTDPMQRVSPSSLTATQSTTPPGTTSGKAGISNKPTSATPQNDSVTHMAGDYDKKGVPSDGGALTVIIILAVLVVTFALLFIIALGCCIRNARRRRDPNGNEPNGDLELGGQADRHYNNRYTQVPIGMPQDQQQQNNRRPLPNPSPDTCRSAGSSCPNGPDAGSSCEELVYATVNKSRKSKVMAADPQREHSVPSKSPGDRAQRPSTSGHSPHKNPVCRAINKVLLKGRSEETTKNKSEPSSVCERVCLMELPPGSSKGSPKQGSAIGPVPSDGHAESGGSTPHSLPPLPASPPPPTSSLPPTSPPPSSTLLPSSSQTPSSTAPPSSSSSSSSPTPPVSSRSPPSSSRKKVHLNSSQLPTDVMAKESDVDGNGGEEDTRDDVTKAERDSKGHLPKESSPCSPMSPGSRVTEDLEQGAQRGAEDGAGSLPLVSPGEKPKVKESLPEPRDDVGEKTYEELKNPSISPDEVVSERFLDGVTDVISLDEVERISREFGLQQADINNIKQSLLYTDPKNIGFHILRKVLSLRGCTLTFQRVLIAMRDCGQKNASDTLIAEFEINMNLEKR